MHNSFRVTVTMLYPYILCGSGWEKGPRLLPACLTKHNIWEVLYVQSVFRSDPIVTLPTEFSESHATAF